MDKLLWLFPNPSWRFQDFLKFGHGQRDVSKGRIPRYDVVAEALSEDYKMETAWIIGRAAICKIL